MDKSTVLVTAAGTATSVNIVKYISGMDRIRVVTTDTNPAELVPASRRWETVHYQVPPAIDRKAFIDRLIGICVEENVDFVYPVHDLEIAAVVESRDRFPKYVRLPALSSEAVQSCSDKWVNYSNCISANLPVPDTWIGSALPRNVFARYRGLMRKPRNGVGSVGVRHVESFDSLTEADLGHEVIYQVFCEGTEYTVDVLILDDDFYAIVRERLETKMGICTKAHVFIDPLLTKLARAISERFALHGLFCFQVIRDSSGAFRIVDINPRCGGGTALTAAAGFPIYEAYFSSMLGRQELHRYKTVCDERSKIGGRAVVCRYYEEVVTRFEGQYGLALG